MRLSSVRGWLPLGLIVSGLVALAAIAAVRAQQATQVTISVSPTVFELSANPGETVENSFRIINGTDQELTLEATPKNFTASGEEGAVNLIEDETSFSLASWISVEPMQATVAARGSQTFDFTIDVPADAEPGGHFGSVIISTQPISVDASGAAVSQEAGPLLLVSVAGDIERAGQIVEFKPQKSFWESGPVVLETRVENQGNVHFKPSGSIVIKNMFGQEVTTLNLEERNVLPSTIRKLVSEWNPGFVVGSYTADLTVVFDDGQDVATASASFIIFPWKVMIPVILGVILLIFLLVKFRRRIAAAGRALAGK